MERYEHLIERMWAELHDAKDYTKAAMKCKEDRSYADAIFDIARQEYSHFIALHGIASTMSATWPQDHVMHSVWEHDRSRLMEHAARVKSLMEQYKG